MVNKNGRGRKSFTRMLRTQVIKPPAFVNLDTPLVHVLRTASCIHGLVIILYYPFIRSLYWYPGIIYTSWRCTWSHQHTGNNTGILISEPSTLHMKCMCTCMHSGIPFSNFCMYCTVHVHVPWLFPVPANSLTQTNCTKSPSLCACVIVGWSMCWFDIIIHTDIVLHHST